MAKIREISLFDVIGEKKERFEFSILTTFNAYLPFYEQIVLRRMVKAGCRVNTLLMDAGQFSACLADPGGKPRSAGRDYTLIPVDAASGVFHPKILLLLGREYAALCVGSHNLTLSGFGKNRELTSLFELGPNSSRQERIIFQDVWQAMKLWSLNQPEELKDSLRFVESEIDWLAGKEESVNQESALFFAAGENTPALWEQINPQLSDKVRRVTMISPFFDEDLRFVREIMESLSPKEFIVGIEPGSVCLPPNSPAKFPDIKFVNAGKLRGSRGYLHAKAVYLETDSQEQVLIIGSANMSGPAWLKGNRQNCESVIVLRSKEAVSAVKEIGLDDLSEAPALAATDWHLIETTRLSRTELFSEKEKKNLLTAVETENGFKIIPKNSGIRFERNVELINSSGEMIHNAAITNILNEEIFLEVPDPQIRLMTDSIKLLSESREIYASFVHHAPAVISKFHKAEHREFFTALESFDLPVDPKFWRIFEQIVFDEGDELPEYMEAGISHRHRTGDLTVKAENPETLQETFAVKTADIGFKNRLNQNITDSLSELIGLLNQRLYSPAEQTQNFTFRTIPDKELGESEEYESEEIVDPKFETVRIASHYYQRTRTMMRRMIKKLDSLNTGEFRPLFAALRQIAVVLGLLHWIRQLEKHERFAGCEKELISIDDEWKLFISAVSFLAKLETVPQEIKKNSERFFEMYSIVVGHLVWLGFDCGFDIAKFDELRRQNTIEDRSDSWTNDEVVEGTACFLKLALPFCNNQQSRITFQKAVENEDTSDWTERNLDWLKIIEQMSKDIFSLPVLNRKARIGDLVIQTKMKKPEILVVSDDPSHIEIVILNAEKRRKKYSSETVAVIEIQDFIQAV